MPSNSPRHVRETHAERWTSPLALRPLPLGRCYPRLAVATAPPAGRRPVGPPGHILARRRRAAGSVAAPRVGARAYWLDGVVPLAYLLGDPGLLARCSTGWTIPEPPGGRWLARPGAGHGHRRYRPYDPWPVFVYLKAATQYQEASGEPRVVPAMQRFSPGWRGCWPRRPSLIGAGCAGPTCCCPSTGCTSAPARPLAAPGRDGAAPGL